MVKSDDPGTPYLMPLSDSPEDVKLRHNVPLQWLSRQWHIVGENLRLVNQIGHCKYEVHAMTPSTCQDYKHPPAGLSEPIGQI